MKKFFFHILLYAAIITIIDLLIGGLGDFLQANAKGGSTKRTEDLVTNETHDIIVLGSSRAHHHYDTPFLSDTLKLNVYNAGYDGNGVILAYGLSSLFLERYRPKLIIFDVTPNFDIYCYAPDNNNSRYLSIIKPYYRRLPIETIMKDISYKDWIEVHSGMLRYNSRMVTYLLDYVGLSKDDNCGYAPMKGILNEDRTESPYLSSEVDSVKIKYVRELISLSKEYSTPIVFIASPWYGALDSSVMQPIKTICEDNDIAFIDYFSDLAFQKIELFNDPGHLNNEGARLFSKKIIEKIDIIK